MNIQFAKIFIVIGVILIIIGILFLFNIKLHFGKLPGDIVIKKENFTFAFPLMSSIIASIVLSFIMWLISKF
ncbi:DUF2905 domain-containing protein [Brachyspira hampsonii]|uniref:DUF2905 domain-containing protein n=1 Tax=Brachyspira hampsonii TaxID=1287055 RepID=A0AAC9TSE3_9SPIR|nr:DUF2905 domain-containing protein [Brachyspira hampsonii]ASJ20986.1 hypothetical protein BHAMNSH16_04740 [Brachyspira hampsonii]ELV06656.1 hypothetical protein H263_02804 [Brachyspira hampsonii 30599]MBW5380232.1 DUF2905 domain-containing protein [Brachyspira hampsonii]MBW5410129.1 DUF2905 domain-containing protein [Brachyspira hampsonii]OEJ13285.1 hypothetical protein A9496_02430 [Brachyspira hampsonii]